MADTFYLYPARWGWIKIEVNKKQSQSWDIFPKGDYLQFNSLIFGMFNPLYFHLFYFQAIFFLNCEIKLEKKKIAIFSQNNI